ncbi:MAG: RNA polymerase sporulation sigma factor SigH [Lachnospiraceae bacterium]
MLDHLLELSDEELIEKYNCGEANACDILLERYKNLVRKKAKAMFIAGGDEDDLIQEGMIGLYKAIRDYRYEKNTSFMTFASMCINNQICTAVSAANRKKHNPLNSYLSFYMPIEGDEEGDGEGETKLMDVLHFENELSPEEQLIDRETADAMVENLYTVLSTMEKQVLKYFLDGDGYVEIAVKLGKSPKSIDNALQRIKGKMMQILQK